VAERNGGGLLRKLQKGNAKEKMKGNEKKEGMGKGNSALVVGNIRLCQWGLGQSPDRKKTNFVYSRLHKALLFDR